MEVYRPGRSTKARGLIKLLVEVQELIGGGWLERKKYNNADKTKYTKCTKQTESMNTKEELYYNDRSRMKSGGAGERRRVCSSKSSMDVGRH